jgi:tetratricopeptide (TPR) repeat protein
MLVGSPATESASDQPKAAGHLAHAAALASTEPRFLLAGPVAGERRSWDINGILTESRSQEALLAAADRYSKLVDVPAIGAEARLRRGAVRLRVGLPVAAIEDFTIVTARAADPYLLYLGHLFAGVAYERLRHSSDALQHYRAALDVAPRAQSASVRLVALLMTMDRRDEASTVTEDFFANTPPRDPWRSYSSGDARFWPEYLARLRKALQ